MTEDERKRQTFDLVKRMWSTCKMTIEHFEEAVWKPGLKWRDETDLVEALRAHRRQDADATQPKWKDVFAILRSQSTTAPGGRNQFDLLLDQIRAHKVKLGWVQEAKDMKPEELFDEHLRARTSTILFTWEGTTKGPSDLRNTHLLKPRPDPHGLLQWRAAMKIRQTTGRWREYFEAIGQRAPDFLMMPDEPIEHPPHTESFDAQRRALAEGEAGRGVLAQTEEDLVMVHGSAEGMKRRREAIAREGEPDTDAVRLCEPAKIGSAMQSFLPGGMSNKCAGQGAVAVAPPSPGVDDGQETMEFRRQDDRPGGGVTHG